MKKITLLSLVLSFATNLYAEKVITLDGTIEVPLKITQNSIQSRTLKHTPSPYIQLLKFNLSTEAQSTLSEQLNQIINQQQTYTIEGSESQAQLGMNKVPVLDQGPYGTCVTFANTAAIDAALKKGNYISQLCQLQLGKYLASTGYNPSGWKGSIGPIVLSQMDTFGFVTLEQQKKGCGDIKEYPSDGYVPSGKMTPEAYYAKSQSLSDNKIAWSAMLDFYQRFTDKTDMTEVLDRVKKTLIEGDRMTFGVLLFDTHLGVVGAVGKHTVKNDTWVLTPQIVNDIINNGSYGGHEMIITGFDDNATAIDSDGQVHRGLLTLRNSWSALAGDHGDFYMSYDYFKALTIEIQRIRG